MLEGTVLLECCPRFSRPVLESRVLQNMVVFFQRACFQRKPFVRATYLESIVVSWYMGCRASPIHTTQCTSQRQVPQLMHQTQKTRLGQDWSTVATVVRKQTFLSRLSSILMTARTFVLWSKPTKISTRIIKFWLTTRCSVEFQKIVMLLFP